MSNKPSSGESESAAPVIIKKKKKSEDHGHHGGAWKIAYADFVTAMMAFFLLMWLLNATSEEQKRGLADYFSPVSPFNRETYTGGMIGSKMATQEGALDGRGNPVQKLLPSPGVLGVLSDEEGDSEEVTTLGKESDDVAKEENAGDKGVDENRAHRQDHEHPSPDPQQSSADSESLDQQKAEELVREQEKKQFEEMAEKIKQAIEQDPDLKSFENNILIEQTDDGLRIQLVDRDKIVMFPLGSAEMYPPTKKILEHMAKVIQQSDKKIMIEGHTDSKQYNTVNGYSNWELSADRANASRRVLLSFGIPDVQIEKVIGHADRDPLNPENTEDPANRRISIILLRKGVE